MELLLSEGCDGRYQGEDSRDSIRVDPQPSGLVFFPAMLTKCRNADSVVHDGPSSFFVKPLEREEMFADFLSTTISQERAGRDDESVLYSQGRKL